MPIEKEPEGEGKPAFTPEQIETLSELIQKTMAPTVNAAITTQMKRLEKRFDEKIGARGGDEEQAAVTTQPAKKPTASAEVAELRKMLEDERSRARMSEATKVLTEKLTEAGIKPGLQKFVIGHLLHTEKALAFDEGGNAKFTVRRSRAAGTPVEEIEFDDLGAGVNDWLKGDDAKHFLPAPAPKTQSKPAPTQTPSVQIPQGNQHPSAVPTASEAVANIRSQLASAGITIE